MRKLLPALLAIAAHAAGHPESAWRFDFTYPLAEWKQGLPVGNGRIGAQVWGSGRNVYLTLDRADVWDLRYVPNSSPAFSYRRLRALVEQGRRDLIQAELSPDVSPTADTTPMHVPAGRLTLEFPENTRFESAHLDMRRAEVAWRLKVNGKPAALRVVACAGDNVILAMLEGAGASPRVTARPLSELHPDLVRKLGYQKAAGGSEGGHNWFVQAIPDSGSSATAWATFAQGVSWGLLITISSQHGPDPLRAARSTLAAAQAKGSAALLAQHRAWWDGRWQRSSVSLPDLSLERLWRNGIYKLASSSHGGVPTNLQGLWPPDGQLPPWRGDYHCDMNVQESYWPAYNANQLDLAEPLNRWIAEKAAPEAERFTRRFFGVDGIFMGTSYDVSGRLLGGRSNWMTVQYWLGAGAWVAQHLWWHYSYSGDKEFLRRTGYPLLRKFLAFYEGILEEGQDGRLHVPLSTSPEYFSNELEAWTPDPTCDLSLIRNLAHYCIRAAETLDTDRTHRDRWHALIVRLAPYPASPKNGLMVQPRVEYERSHRHPMHLFPIFPGEDLTIEGNQAERDLIDTSIRNWIFRGLGEWAGHSYPNSIPIAARLGRANHAWNLLNIYANTFVLPNGFHVNGDRRGLGLTIHSATPYTVEAECGFTAALNEMLLQSWGGRIRIFPAVPDAWPDVSFENLRAEGGVLVSAERRGGRVARASLFSEKGGDVRLAWPPGPAAMGRASGVKALVLQPGQRVELRPEEP